MLGKSVHLGVIKTGLESQTLVGNSLVSMYLKLGFVSDVVSWNAMVAGLMENGFGFWNAMFFYFLIFFF
ncbi:hypothetical protein Hanom_Chr17g01578641 [Helianthus anomalus]